MIKKWGTVGVLAVVLLAAPTSVVVAGQVAPDMAACELEDGSTPGQSLPCVWDASRQGNGRGQSFVIGGPAALGK